MDLVIFLLLNIGFTLIITKSSIFEPLRNFFDRISPNFFGILFSCPQCFGFWSPIILSGIIGFTYSVSFINTELYFFSSITPYILDGFISSGVNFLIAIVLTTLDFYQVVMHEKASLLEMQTDLLDDGDPEVEILED